MMKWLIVTIVFIGAVAVLRAQPASSPNPAAAMAMQEGSAATYEQLATAIIAIRNTETNLVRGIMMHYYSTAMRELGAAAEADGASRAANLEAAARAITDIAGEGDARIQAIRQRLIEEGHHHHHHHHADDQEDEDYIFIDSDEKKGLLDLATSVARLGPNASDDDVNGAMANLSSLFEAAMQDE